MKQKMIAFVLVFALLFANMATVLAADTSDINSNTQCAHLWKCQSFGWNEYEDAMPADAPEVTFSCMSCGTTLTVQTQMDLELETEATCSQPGSGTLYFEAWYDEAAQEAGSSADWMYMAYVDIPAYGHISDEYTDNGDGTHSFTCLYCGETFTEAHDYEDRACTLCGSKLNYYTVTVLRGNNTNLSVMDAEGNALAEGANSVQQDTALTVSYSAYPGFELIAYPETQYTVTGDLIIETAAEGVTYALTLTHDNGAEPITNVPDLSCIPFGTAVTLTAGNPITGYEFIGWYEPNGNCITAEKTCTFMMTGNMTRQARYRSLSGTVTFVCNTQTIKTISQVQSITASDFPAPAAAKYGYEFAKWDQSVDQVNAALLEGKNVTVSAVYTPIKTSYTVSVYNGNDEKPTEYTYSESKVLSFSAKTVPNMTFGYWTMNGEVISYNTTVTIHVATNCTLRAVYSAAAVEAVGTAQLLSSTYNIATRKLVSVSYLTVPKGCTIMSAGLLAASATSTKYNPNTELNASNADYVKQAASTKQTVQYTWSKGNVTTGDIWYLRAYLVYRDAQGGSHTITGPRITVCAGTDYDYREKATAKITSTSWNATTRKATFVAYLTVPQSTDGAQAVIKAAGLVASSAQNYNPATALLTAENAQYTKQVVSTKQAVQYSWNKGSVSEGDTWYARAYLVYEWNGETRTVYGDLVKYTATQNG